MKCRPDDVEGEIELVKKREKFKCWAESSVFRSSLAVGFADMNKVA